MMRLLARDERESATDLAADHLAYLFLSFGLLAAVAWRSFVLHEAAWDLLALVILGGLVGTAFRSMRGVAGRRWLGTAGMAAVAGAVAAAVVGLLTR